jgi:hypothetical protein
MRAKDRSALEADRPIAQCRAFRRAGDNADVSRVITLSGVHHDKRHTFQLLYAPVNTLETALSWSPRLPASPRDYLTTREFDDYDSRDPSSRYHLRLPGFLRRLPAPASPESRSFQNAELLERDHSIIEAYFLGDQSFLDGQHGCPREMHFAAGPHR